MAFGGGGSGGGAISTAADVALSSVADDQVLAYNSSTAKWANKTMEGGGSQTAADVGAVATSSPGMQLDYGVSLPPAGTEGRFFIVIPE